MTKIQKPRLLRDAIPFPPDLEMLFERQRGRGISEDELAFAVVVALDADYVAMDGELPPDASQQARFAFNLIRTLREPSGEPPVDADKRATVATSADAIRKLALASKKESDQYGYGNLLSSIRHQVLGREVPVSAHQAPAPMQRVMPFSATGAGASELGLVIEFPAVGLRSHLDTAKIYKSGDAIPFLEVPVIDITQYRAASHAAAVLGLLPLEGAGQITFGDWYTADGAGRELAAAQIAGLVVRVGKQTENGMGGVSPNYALTEAGRDWVKAQGLAAEAPDENGPPAYVKLEAIRVLHPSVHFTSDTDDMDSLAESSGLAVYSEEWSGIAVVAGDGELLHAWITESTRPFDVTAEFVQVLKDGRTLPWAKEHEESFDQENTFRSTSR